MFAKIKQRKEIWFLLLAMLLLGILLARPGYRLYKDVSFYWVERSPAEKLVKAYCEEMHISYGQYPKRFIELLENNPETQEFVLNYPFRQSEAYDLSEFEGSSTVPLFLQWDTRWGYETYGSDCIGITGCGPTCLAMVGYYLTGSEEFTPDKIAVFAQKNGYYARGYGSSWTLISEGSGKLGLKATELPLSKESMVTAVQEGKPIILALGSGEFTTAGHYIVLTGWEQNAFRINDPNSVENSERLWTYEELESQIRNIWAMESECKAQCKISANQWTKEKKRGISRHFQRFFADKRAAV